MPHLACLLRRLGDVDVHVRRSGLTVLERLATAALLSGEQRAAVALALPEPPDPNPDPNPDPDPNLDPDPDPNLNWP